MTSDVPTWTPEGSYTDVLYAKAEGIARISINRPEVHNAFDDTLIADLTRGTGHFNLAVGTVGSCMGIGAALSTTPS